MILELREGKKLSRLDAHIRTTHSEKSSETVFNARRVLRCSLQKDERLAVVLDLAQFMIKLQQKYAELLLNERIS